MPDFSPESMAKASRWFTEEVWPRRVALNTQLREAGLRHFHIAQTVQNYAACIHRGTLPSAPHARKPSQNGVRPKGDSKLNPLQP